MAPDLKITGYMVQMEVYGIDRDAFDMAQVEESVLGARCESGFRLGRLSRYFVRI
jgi:hypothetical protein